MRAILLERWDVVKELTPILKTKYPDLKTYFEQIAKTEDPQKLKFLCSTVILMMPGLRPYMTEGHLREAPFASIDNFRDNWWCKPRAAVNNFTIWDLGRYSQWPRSKAPTSREFMLETYPITFLSQSEQKQAKVEFEMLNSLAAAPSYLTALVLEYVRKHPSEPLAAESLHLAVRATRYACQGDENTAQFSRTAFLLLHRRYPNSKWAQFTPYWFDILQL